MQEESESEEELDGLNLEGDDGAFPRLIGTHFQLNDGNRGCMGFRVQLHGAACRRGI